MLHLSRPTKNLLPSTGSGEHAEHIRLRADYLFQDAIAIAGAMEKSHGSFIDAYGQHPAPLSESIGASSGLPQALSKELFYSHKAFLGKDDVFLSGARLYNGEKADAIKGMRIKDPEASDGKGQQEIKDQNELESYLHSFRGSTQQLILEPNLKNPEALSVGTSIAFGEKFSYCAKQHQLGQTTAFGGVTLFQVPGGLSDLIEYTGLASDTLELGPQELLQAIRKSEILFSILQQERIITHPRKLSCDILRGERDDGKILSGITDLTPRIGGTSYPELLGMREILKGRSHAIIDSRLSYQSAPTDSSPDGEFMNLGGLIITRSCMH